MSNGRLNTRVLITGGALIGVGGLIGLTGAALASSVLVAAVRRRVREMEVPPRELAKRKWVQTKSAAAAGVGAWQGDGATQRAHSS